MKLVVTGNIGCGKSTVVRFMQQRLPDYELFDYDKMVAELYEDDIVKMQLDTAFGTHNKGEIGSIVFTYPKEMEKLRIILDGWVLTNTQIAFKKPNIILDIPLYFEYIQSALHSFTDLVICVASDPELQLERVKARSGWSEEKIHAVMNRQITQRTKVQLSDYTIWNIGTVDSLQAAVDDCVDFLNNYSPY